MLKNICKRHNKEYLLFCQEHNKYLCSDCNCESIFCLTNCFKYPFDNNNNKNDLINKAEFNINQAEKIINNIEKNINDFINKIIEIKNILNNFLTKNKNILNNIKNSFQNEKKRLNIDNIIKISNQFDLKIINENTEKLNKFIFETITLLDLDLTKKLFNEDLFPPENKEKIFFEENSEYNSVINENNFDNNSIILDSYFSYENNNNIEKNKFIKSKHINMKRLSFNKIDKIASIIFYKKKYLAFTKFNESKVYFDLLDDELTKFINERKNFETFHKKNINYIKELNNFNLLTCSIDKTMKVFFINFEKEIISIQLYEIQTQKSIIKAIECKNLLITLMNFNNDNIPDSIIQIYNNQYIEINTEKIFFDNKTANDILYLKNDNFGLEEDLNEFVLSFSELEKIVFFDMKNKFNKNILNNIKCSNKIDTMKIYNNLIIIGGNYYFYFIDIYNKNIILKKEIKANIKSFNILKNLIFIGNKNGNLHIYKILNEKNLEKITQKKLTNNNIVKYIYINEYINIIYIYYYPYIDIIKINEILFN